MKGNVLDMAVGVILGAAFGKIIESLVKDIISGVFYLLDDAFRVGEYIQSGTYKGTLVFIPGEVPR